MRSFWKRVILISSVTFLTSVAVLSLLKKPIQRLFGLDPYVYEREFFSVHNKDTTGFELCRQITLVDTKEGDYSRKYIADVINYVLDASPSIVGIDMNFSHTHGQKEDQEDAYLAEVIRRHTDKLVLSSAYDSDAKGFLFSFFGSPEDGLTYGAVGSYGAIGSYDNWRTKRHLSKKDTFIETFPYLLAKRSGQIINEQLEERFINYSSQYYPLLSTPVADSLQSYFSDKANREHITGHIVIIGNGSELYDIHNLSFKVEGKYKLSGLRLNAYQTRAFIDKSGYLKEIPWYWNLLISFLVILVCALGFCWCNLRIERSRQSGKFKKQYVLIILKFIYILVIEFIAAVTAVWCCIGLFHYIPDSLYIMFAFLLFDPINSLLSAKEQNNKRFLHQ